MLKETLLKAVKAGGDVLMSFFNGTFKIMNKEGINNPVTEADLAAEKAIFEVIRNQFPDHYLLSEEAGILESTSNYKWIIDPIDGTINFAHGIPICCVSIGIEKDGEMVMGAVYSPALNELYIAEKGKGAWLNDKPIKVSAESALEHACLVTGFPYTYLDEPNGPLQCFERFIRKGVPVRRLGSAALDLCWVAAGRFDGFYEHKLQPWDSAAGYLIVEEAGGKVSDMKGSKYSPYKPGVVATNGLIHDDLVKVLNNEHDFFKLDK
jgi:myo-inositol-1(or 4)-monophosphatase